MSYSTTAGSITHAYAITGSNNPAIQVSKDRWNADLIAAGGTNEWLMVRDSGKPDGWGWGVRIPSDGRDNLLGGTAAGGDLSTGVGNTLLGANAGQVITTGAYNTIVGYHGGLLHQGNYMTAVGAGAGAQNITGANNTFVGYVAGAGNIDGADNTCVGVNAGTTNQSGYGNTYIGSAAGQLNTGQSNTVVGNAAGATSGVWNYNAYFGKFSANVETGSANACFGYKSGWLSSGGDRNTYLGNSAAFDHLSGSDNVYVGYNGGDNCVNGSGNVGIGSGTIFTAAATSAIAIGYHAEVAANSAIAIGATAYNAISNTTVIGNANHVACRVGGNSTRFDLGTLSTGGVAIYAAGSTNGGNFCASTDATADTSILGTLDFGTTGTLATEKRGFTMQTTLVGSAASAITADTTFYTTNGGVGGERVRLTAAGLWTSRSSMVAHNATSIPSGGTAGAGYLFSSTANFGVFFGAGVPTLSAAKGSLYLRSDGSGTTDRIYVNTNGGGTWTYLTTGA